MQKADFSPLVLLDLPWHRHNRLISHPYQAWCTLTKTKRTDIPLPVLLDWPWQRHSEIFHPYCCSSYLDTENWYPTTSVAWLTLTKTQCNDLPPLMLLHLPWQRHRELVSKYQCCLTHPDKDTVEWSSTPNVAPLTTTKTKRTGIPLPVLLDSPWQRHSGMIFRP